MHMLQMEETKRSQRFIPVKEWLTGERESEIIDFSEIDKIPMEFLAHTGDEHCSYDEALRMQKVIKSPVDIRIFTKPHSTFDPPNHYFTSGRNTDRYFFYQL